MNNQTTTASIKAIYPIFILRTRSFWLGIFPAILTIFNALMSEAQASGGSAGPIATLMATVMSAVGADVSAEAIHRFMLLLSPVYALIVAQQRSGLARPYAAVPQGIDPPPEVIVEVPKAAVYDAVAEAPDDKK